MPTRRALRFVVWAEVALLGVLAATGLWLSRYYRPTRVGFFGDMTGVRASVAWAHRVRVVHTVSGMLFIWTALVLLGLCIAVTVRQPTGPRSRLWILGAAFAVLAWVTSFTGYLLPWDQLALRAVTLDADFRGMWSAAYDDNVRFVLMDSREISQSLLRNWFLVHSFVLPPLLLSALVLLRRRGHDQQAFD